MSRFSDGTASKEGSGHVSEIQYTPTPCVYYVGGFSALIICANEVCIYDLHRIMGQ